MSAIHPHCRVLRAEAHALRKEARLIKERDEATVHHLTVVLTLACMADAKDQAAAQLEEEEAVQAERVAPKPSDPTFNPKGRP